MMSNCVDATINHLPTELLCSILQRTDCEWSLQMVCKRFAAHYFDAFFQACATSSSLSLSLRDCCSYYKAVRVTSSKEKVKRLYEYLRTLIEDLRTLIEDLLPIKNGLGVFNNNEKEIENKIENLNYICSIEQLRQLDNWLEDVNLLKLFEEIKKNDLSDQNIFLDVSFLKEIQEKNISEKAEAIRQWLGDNRSLSKLENSTQRHKGTKTQRGL